MIKPVHLSTLFSLLVVSLCLVVAGQQPQQAVDANVGREDPFATLAEKKPAASQQNQEEPVVVDQKPDLFVETVTLNFIDAENLKKVLDSMLSDYGTIVANPKSNSLIICDTRDNLAIILAEIKKADKTQQQIMFVETVTLKFLKAKNLKNALDQMSSKYGSIAIDDNTNSLIICDTKDNLEKILAEIKKADQTPEQIMIEVVILDVQLDDDTEIGINWDILSDEMYDIGYRQNFTTRLGSTAESAATIANATAFNTTSAGGIAGNLSIISGTIRNVVHLIQQKKDVEILASPRIMVVSGKSASIEAVRELPYNEITDTSEGGRLSSTEFKKVGVKLNVTAMLTEDDLIFLAVDSEQNVAVGESDTAVPIIDTRNTKSEVLLQDGQVVILGGLRRQEKTKEVDQIPILGDIPLLGLLFKSSDTVIKNSELIVFLSPHIYKGEPMSEDEMAKFKEISERPVLSLPDDSKNSLRIPTNAEQKKNNIEQKKKQPSKQKYPTSAK
jgi:type IV pilus assembly protein PilQ